MRKSAQCTNSLRRYMFVLFYSKGGESEVKNKYVCRPLDDAANIASFSYNSKKKRVCLKKHTLFAILFFVFYASIFACEARNALTRSEACLSFRFTIVLRVLRNYNRQCLQQLVARKYRRSLQRAGCEWQALLALGGVNIPRTFSLKQSHLH